MLTVERCEDDPNVVHYTAGNWEDELEATAKVSAEMRKASTPNVTATVMDDRVRHLRDLAVALTRCKGTSFADGLATVTVCRDGPLTIRYWPKQGLLDVWYGKKVLVIERREGKPHVVHYEPGIWEQELAAQAAQRHKETLAPGNGDSAFAVIFPKGRHVLAGEEEAKPVKKKPPLGFLG